MQGMEIFARYAPRDAREAGDREAILRLYRVLGDGMARREESAAHYTASCWITDETGARTVLAWHNIYRAWSWIGGHADGEQNLLRVALKEAKEETGLVCAALSDAPVSIELLAVNGHEKRGVWVPSHLHVNATYHLIAEPGQTPRVKADENSAVRWIDAADAPGMSDEAAMRPIYEKLIARTRGC